jgi:drug/metabolite transporter (DMT)-like permease
MTIRPPKFLSLSSSILLIAPFFLWGTAMVAMKGVLPHTTPLFVGGIRILPAGILVLLFAHFGGRSQATSLKAWLWITLFALVDAAIIDSQPLVVALLSSWLFGEVIGLWGWLGLGLGICGISLIGLPEEWFFTLWQTQTLSIEWSWRALFDSGEWLMFLASLSMAVGTILIRFVSRHVDPVVATGWHLILGGLPLFILSGFSEIQQWQAITLNDWLNLAYATIFGSAIAYGIFFYLASKGNLTSLSSLTFLTPIFALSFGNLILEEKLSLLQWGGVSLTLISIYLINQREQIGNQIRALWTIAQKNTIRDQ